MRPWYVKRSEIVRASIFRFLLMVLAFLTILSCSIALAAKPVISEGTNAASAEANIAREALKLNQKWNGDFDKMVERRFIRVLVTFSKTNYFFDGAKQQGATYEVMKAFEKAGKPPILIKAASEYLEDEDLMEMVNAGPTRALKLRTEAQKMG